MREMTSAEFAKANLAGLEEPIAIRRYTKTVGVYYPEGYAAPTAVINMGSEASPEQVEALRLQLEAIDNITVPVAATKRIEELEDEVKRLKRELAARPAVANIVLRHPEDPFAGLAKQDKEFFERKLGKKK